MATRHYLHYWAPERAGAEFDGRSEPVQRLRHTLYGSRKVGDVVWVISRLKNQFVMILWAQVAAIPREVRGKHEIVLTRQSRSHARAIPLPLETLRKLPFKNRTDMSGPLSRILVGPLATIRVLDAKAVPILERLWDATEVVMWSGANEVAHENGREGTPIGAGERRSSVPEESQILSEDDESAFPEGVVSYQQHRDRERDPALIERVKRDRMKTAGVLECEACGFDFAKVFGTHGSGFIEAHHTKPVATLDGSSKTRASDIALVCSNCHRMLHRGEELLSVQQLQDIVLKRRKLPDAARSVS